MEKIVQSNMPSLQHIAHGPGIYKFFDSEHRLLYVGKAIDLSRRVKQYFTQGETLDTKISQLVRHIASIETIATASEFDALILEAQLIRTLQPKYNSLAKDDKSPLYITIEKQTPMPIVQCVRKTSIDRRKYEIFGPFQSGRTARNILYTLRRIVPYCTQKKRSGKPCFYSHIGLCDPCPSVISKIENSDEQKRAMMRYRKHVRQLRFILGGNIRKVSEQLKQEMSELAKRELFEKAALIRNQMKHLHALLTKQYDPELYLSRDHMLEHVNEVELTQLESILKPYIQGIQPLARIECFDISSLSGLQGTGSMVVLTKGQIDRSQYRRFKIRLTQKLNDTAMMREVISRRFKHGEWTYPALLIVDGGKSQVHAAKKTLFEMHISIPIIGLAKRFEIIHVLSDPGSIHEIQLPLDSPALLLVERIRDEAHRFAHTYQLFLRSHESITGSGV